MADKMKLQELVTVLRGADQRSEWEQNSYVIEAEEAMCGTAMCSAGWAATMAGYYPRFDNVNRPYDSWYRVGERNSGPNPSNYAYALGKTYLELNAFEANTVFLASASVRDIDDMEAIINAVADDKLVELINDEDQPIDGFNYGEAQTYYNLYRTED